jgi:hypothetical protein
MAETRSIGLKSIKIGAVANDGGMGTALTALGETFKGSASLETADGQVTPFETEESSDPVEQFEEKGITTLKWSIINLDPAALVRVLGGKVDDNDDTKWLAPSEVPVIEASIEVITRFNKKIEIVRARVRARFMWNLTRTDIAQVAITATLLQPTKAGVAPYTISDAA